MGQVIDLTTRKLLATTPQAPSVATQQGTVYECSRCQAKEQLFKLLADGHVVCADCDARMSNLTTTFTGDQHVA